MSNTMNYMERNGEMTSEEFKTREPILTFLRTLTHVFNADACVMYGFINSMHEEEKKIEFKKRFGERIKIKDYTGKINYIDAKDINKYSVLKFVGVGEYSDKKWIVKYSERPEKYVILDDNRSTDHVDKEGLTGYTARTGILKYYNDVNNIKCKKIRDIENDDTKKGIHPPCKKCLILPIEFLTWSKTEQKEKLRKVVIRFDIYEKNKNFNEEYLVQIVTEDDEQIRKHLNGEDNNISLDKESKYYKYLSLSCKILWEQSMKEAEGKTYNDIYKGSRLIKALTNELLINKISKQRESDIRLKNNSLNVLYYDRIIHLFFVLRRHTYLGQEEIINRVILFVDDLWKQSKFDIDFSFKEHLEQFKDHENLMLYDVSGYRDHFMHQLHVFVLGYIIINAIGFDSFKKRLEEIFEQFNKNTGIDRAFESSVTISDDSVLRIWFLISFFHDINYLLQELSPGISKFIKKLFGDDLDLIVPEICWEQFAFTEKYVQLLEELCNHFNLPAKKEKGSSTSRIKLFSMYLEKIIKKQDHSVFGCLFLLNKLIPKIGEIISKIGENSIGNKNDRILDMEVRKFEIYMAAFSISIHGSIFANLLIDNTSRIEFNDFPMEVLLLFCDACQEWGRIKKVMIKDSPYVIDFKKFSFEDLIVEENHGKDSKTEMKIILKYNDSYNDKIFDELQNFFLTKRSKIFFKNYFFVITYKFNDGQSRDIPFN